MTSINDTFIGAIVESHNDIVREILNVAHSTDSKGMTPLHHAAASGNETAATLLLGAGAQIDKTDSAGNTPLMLAVEWSREPVARMLLDRGADPLKVFPFFDVFLFF